MLIFPAIDLKDGQVVRLKKGNFNTVHQVADNPIKTAEAFLDAGARYIHVVDLDGARNGRRKNSCIVQRIVETGIKVELGGGIRTLADLASVFDLGIWRAVIGSAAVTDPEFVKNAIEIYGSERIAVGIDTLNGFVRTEGWEEDSGLDYLKFASSMEKLGVRNIIFTDIDTDGMLTDPSYEKLAALQHYTNCSITASGGVSCNEDVLQLCRQNLSAVIIGKAWYAGKIDLAAVIKECGSQE